MRDNRLTLRFLGPYRVLDAQGYTIHFRTDKQRALLAYLAIESTYPHKRDTLAAMFWPNMSPDKARNNLRLTFHRLRKKIDPPQGNLSNFLVGKDSIQFFPLKNVWVDINVFAEKMAAITIHKHYNIETCEKCIIQARQIAELYRGALLQDLYLSDNLAYSEWVTARREYFQRQMITLLYTLAEYERRHGNLPEALFYARRQLELEPWREETYRQLMGILARQREWNAALLQYQICCQTLAEELDVAPDIETQTLYKRILKLRNTPQRQLPDEPAPLVGRRKELSVISQFVADPAKRLLTIVGPGGIGKTHLALAAAKLCKNIFLDGVCFLFLSSVSSSSSILPAIAKHLGIAFGEYADTEERVIDYLQRREMLFVLDNFDHLLAGRNELDRILDLPHINIIVTSRQRLGHRAEHLLEISGLSYSTNEHGEDDSADEQSAIQLFYQCAAQLQQDPATIPEKDVVRICQLVAGLPLGIELTAKWLRILSTDEIVSRLEKDLNFIISSDQARLHTVFEHSWRMLTAEERAVFRKMSVFRSGSSQEATEVVAGATKDILFALVDKSLLRRTRAHRYEMHPLIRQYAKTKLVANEAEFNNIQVRHSNYFLQYLHDRDPSKGSKQKKYLYLLTGDIENIRKAWRLAIEHHRRESIKRVQFALWAVYEINGWFREGYNMFAYAAQMGDQTNKNDRPTATQLHISILGRQAWFAYRLGNGQESQTIARECLALLEHEEIDLPAEKAHALFLRGIISFFIGNYKQAESDLLNSLSICRLSKEQLVSLFTLHALSLLTYSTGAYSKTKSYLEEAILISRNNLDLRGLSVSNILYGRMSFAIEDYAQAEKLLKEGISVSQRLQDRFGIMLHHFFYGEIICQQGDFYSARAYLEESLVLALAIGERWFVADICRALGNIWFHLDNRQQSRLFYCRAIKLAQELNALPTILACFTGLARLLAQEGEETSQILAASFAKIAEKHPASSYQTREKAEKLLSEWRMDFPDFSSEDIEQQDLNDTIQELLVLSGFWEADS